MNPPREGREAPSGESRIDQRVGGALRGISQGWAAFVGIPEVNEGGLE